MATQPEIDPTRCRMLVTQRTTRYDQIFGRREQCKRAPSHGRLYCARHQQQHEEEQRAAAGIARDYEVLLTVHLPLTVSAVDRTRAEAIARKQGEALLPPGAFVWDARAKKTSP